LQYETRSILSIAALGLAFTNGKNGNRRFVSNATSLNSGSFV
jgi:hypothetical protein